MAKLTKKEADWLDKLQALMDECPSERLGAYTRIVVDNSISTYQALGVALYFFTAGALNYFVLGAATKARKTLGENHA